jgi:hypothetical protein
MLEMRAQDDCLLTVLMLVNREKGNVPSGHGHRRHQEPRGKQRRETTLDAKGYSRYRKR